MTMTWQTVLSLRDYPQAFYYLILWFMMSDGVFVIGTIATLFADAEIDWGCMPKRFVCL
jgi:MFS-type transporter involved in bile tolerance (Atg22 family)